MLSNYSVSIQNLNIEQVKYVIDLIDKWQCQVTIVNNNPVTKTGPFDTTANKTTTFDAPPTTTYKAPIWTAKNTKWQPTEKVAAAEST